MVGIREVEEYLEFKTSLNYIGRPSQKKKKIITPKI
jgi:hypothetical protein